ncbi:hypothetical protein PK98_12190 [Croceibacterium mercuriale]|uniref:Lipoprotein n=1 Tax=Croceibacterium mercuriale TaxID=1572751 RepID=A0A0B2BYF5_9SPHN|nr:hypothetical protein [Croceibacterium mercuriale]KHL24696.1 hypothetical protein PK98_12190 [Croceibacterium mercuriale]
MNRHTFAFAGALIASAALSACNATEDEPLPGEPGNAVEQVAPGAAPAITPAATPIPDASHAVPVDNPDAPSPTTGGDGSDLVLTPLTAADLSGITLAGELACSFSQSAGGPSLMLARGDVADAAGRASFAVKIGSYVEQGLALQDGGYDAMLDGGRFGTRGLTLTVRKVGAAARSGGESPPRTAELLAQRGDGAERVFAGFWTCGP